MTAKPAYDAVVFDLLTALLDSWRLWNTVAGSDDAGMRWRREYLTLTYDAGRYRPYEDIIRDAAGRAGIRAESAETLMSRWPELSPWNDAPAVLAELRRMGVKLGIATNSSDALAAHAVAVAGGGFDAVVTAEAVGFYKPRPEPYLRVLEMLGTAPARTLFVAGSAADVPGATGAGMPVYWHNRIGLKQTGDVEALQTETTLSPLLDLVRGD